MTPVPAWAALAPHLLPEVAGDVVEAAKQAALAEHCDRHETVQDCLYSGTILDIRAAIKTAAPIIAADAERRVRRTANDIPIGLLLRTLAHFGESENALVHDIRAFLEMAGVPIRKEKIN